MLFHAATNFKIGELAFALLNSLSEDEAEANDDLQFYNSMNEAIQVSVKEILSV